MSCLPVCLSFCLSVCLCCVGWWVIAFLTCYVARGIEAASGGGVSLLSEANKATLGKHFDRTHRHVKGQGLNSALLAGALVVRRRSLTRAFCFHPASANSDQFARASSAPQKLMPRGSKHKTLSLKRLKCLKLNGQEHV